MTLWLNSAALARSRLSRRDVLALTSEGFGSRAYEPSDEPELLLADLGAPTVIYVSQQVDRYSAMWQALNGHHPMDD
ncbi:hypothetical protein [Angustibacter sp. Root456]|uniref:hypothetical protein n=1 Tax=Angustibacter sp. Root456 TaxID=1736539 RepID=UPI0006FBC091|nr:hypothetical protein [Angustibacter sp. Root456]KQX68821.1 hypothetical protein ASD06_17135 [Angustibacter sp. Root456]